MSDNTKVLLSLITASVIAGAAALLGAVTELEPGGEIRDIGSITWLVVAVSAAMAGAKDLHSYVNGKKVAIKNLAKMSSETPK